ncbi:hypothetical protein B0H17DRAFT_1190854 [Mycena rosella]|uniref:Uncharacterized protein n=1 Tax=Mycena rosella TaxID=1033263 RepID=A0AAD7H1N3_MYCRO|nr:hypothetical protein B0H17DRAFT_1190854 [Mycena rosella]
MLGVHGGGKAESVCNKTKMKAENARLRKEMEQLKINLGVAHALLSTAKAEQAKATTMLKNVEGEISMFIERERWMERKAKDQSVEIDELIQLKSRYYNDCIVMQRELDDTCRELAIAQHELEEPARKRFKPDRVPRNDQQ